MEKGYKDINHTQSLKNEIMDKKLFYIIITALMAICPLKALSWGVDPGRVVAIETASLLAHKTLDAQIAMQTLQTTGHLWIKEEVEATTNFQKQFNDYLDSFHNILSIAAEIYGVYYEVKTTATHIKNISNELATGPTNALAVAFSAKRNVVYRNLVKTTLDIIMDIRKVCFDNAKMTEQEKNKIVSNIRPKLHKINRQLAQLTIALRYTSFLDVWNEITGRAYMINHNTKLNVIEKCRRDWWNNAQSVR